MGPGRGRHSVLCLSRQRGPYSTEDVLERGAAGGAGSCGAGWWSLEKGPERREGSSPENEDIFFRRCKVVMKQFPQPQGEWEGLYGIGPSTEEVREALSWHSMFLSSHLGPHSSQHPAGDNCLLPLTWWQSRRQQDSHWGSNGGGTR